MGFRLNIKHNDIEYGDDHKLYGYIPLKYLSSFNIILPEIKKQWEPLETYSEDTIYGVYFCIFCPTEELILDEDTFSKFADAYIEDLPKRYRKLADSLDPVHVYSYMNKLKNLPGEKVLYWK